MSAGGALVALSGESMYAWTRDFDRLGVRVAGRHRALAGHTGEGKDDRCSKDAEDDDDDQEFDQGEARFNDLSRSTRLDVA